MRVAGAEGAAGLGGAVVVAVAVGAAATKDQPEGTDVDERRRVDSALGAWREASMSRFGDLVVLQRVRACCRRCDGATMQYKLG